MKTALIAVAGGLFTVAALAALFWWWLGQGVL